MVCIDEVAQLESSPPCVGEDFFQRIEELRLVKLSEQDT